MEELVLRGGAYREACDLRRHSVGRSWRYWVVVVVVVVVVVGVGWGVNCIMFFGPRSAVLYLGDTFWCWSTVKYQQNVMLYCVQLCWAVVCSTTFCMNRQISEKKKIVFQMQPEKRREGGRGGAGHSRTDHKKNQQKHLVTKKQKKGTHLLPYVWLYLTVDCFRIYMYVTGASTTALSQAD